MATQLIKVAYNTAVLLCGGHTDLISYNRLIMALVLIGNSKAFVFVSLCATSIFIVDFFLPNMVWNIFSS